MHRRQKKPYAVIFAIAVALVLFGALRDMDRLKNPPEPEVTIVRYNYADDAGDFARLPRDTSPVMINIGTLAKDEDGTYSLTASDIEAITLPQREVNLLVALNDLPEASAFGEMVEREVTHWKRKNNKIVEIILDWQAETAPDIEKLGTLATDLRNYLKMDYWVGLGLRRGWFEADPAQLDWPQSGPDGIRSYVYYLDEAQREGESLDETLSALDAFKLPYTLYVQDLPPEKEAERLIRARPLFNGFVLPR